MTRDEQEALSLKYSDNAIILLPLLSGNLAVFNRAFDLCGILDLWSCDPHIWNVALTIWHPPHRRSTKPTLEDVGL